MDKRTRVIIIQSLPSRDRYNRKVPFWVPLLHLRPCLIGYFPSTRSQKKYSIPTKILAESRPTKKMKENFFLPKCFKTLQNTSELQEKLATPDGDVLVAGIPPPPLIWTPWHRPGPPRGPIMGGVQLWGNTVIFLRRLRRRRFHQDFTKDFSVGPRGSIMGGVI